MGHKSLFWGDTPLPIRTKSFFRFLHGCFSFARGLPRRIAGLPANEKNKSLCSPWLCGEIKLALNFK